MDLTMEEIGKRAKNASRKLALLDTDAKNQALKIMAESILKNSDLIIKENAKDLEQAKADGLNSAMTDRLMLNEKRVQGMANGINDIISLPDPVGKIYDEKKMESGISVHRITIPIGVFGIIYESRPNVTADVASLCIKSGNAVILRGGKEAINSNRIIASILSSALKEAGLPEDGVMFVDSKERTMTNEMLKLDEYIDIIIPRGGSGLIKFVSQNSSIPVVKHDAGICSVYIDETADIKKAVDITVNSKVQRPGVCNAAETLLVHRAWTKNLVKVLSALKDAGVEIRGCENTIALYPDAIPATKEDWETEYGELIIAVKIVDSIKDAIEHVETHGSHHTDVIVTESGESADYFTKAVDSSAVIVNASTRFNDGGQFGLGAEMGISTQKLHCRGPMGLEELTTYKFVATGDGTIRS